MAGDSQANSRRPRRWEQPGPVQREVSYGMKLLRSNRKAVRGPPSNEAVIECVTGNYRVQAGIRAQDILLRQNTCSLGFKYPHELNMLFLRRLPPPDRARLDKKLE